jgi:nitronate monooxygenase
MKQPLIIQGGMGVGVSDWRLARAVSLEGELGVVSGTGVNSMLIRRLQLGDADGQMRRALQHFPDPSIAQEIIATYYVDGGIDRSLRFKRSSLPSVHSPLALQRLYVAASFVEVWLAKEGHGGMVGINVLEKLQTSNLPVLYGAMLAGVDHVLVGAGVPREIPGALDALAKHEPTSIAVTVTGASEATNVRTTFDPRAVVTMHDLPSIRRPQFLAIVSSSTLAIHLVQKATGRVDGFVVEGVLAGGHNAPPRGPMKLNERGEPIYGKRDEADIDGIRALGLPFWLAGSFGSPERLTEALALGATGIQVGTAFAFCDESGLSKGLRDEVIARWLTNTAVKSEAVFTDPLASPTGFPLKVVMLPDTLADAEIYQARPRKCDLGYLRQLAVRDDGTLIYRCPAEPVKDYVKKGGKEEDTIDRKCLCNALLANIGLAQRQERGYEEQPLLTAGDDLASLGRLFTNGHDHYSAREVLAYLKSGVTVTMSQTAVDRPSYVASS